MNIWSTGIALTLVGLIAIGCSTPAASVPVLTTGTPSATVPTGVLPQSTQPADTDIGISPLPPEQTEEYVLPAGSAVKYTSDLDAGAKVSGFVQLTGDQSLVDASREFHFQVLGPGDETVLDWTGDYVANNYHHFDFTATYSGTYKIVVITTSDNPETLLVQFQPPGWETGKKPCCG